MAARPPDPIPALGPAALYYAQTFGWAVFPLHTAAAGTCSCARPDCNRAGKHPRTRDGFKSASKSPDQISAWWATWPDAGIGVATGAVSGFDVLDVDAADGRDGEAALAAITQTPLPATPYSLTGGGGRHLLFLHAEGLACSRDRIARGLDVRADGGYIVAPPSAHPSGRSYAWDALARPGDVPTAPWPGWLLALAQQRPSPAPTAPVAPVHTLDTPMTDRVRRATAYLAQIPSAISNQGGHDQTWMAALALVVGFDLPPGVALDVLLRDYNPRCRPPWSTRELEHKVWTADRDATKPRGYLLNAPKPERAHTERTRAVAAAPLPAEAPPVREMGDDDEPPTPPAPPAPPGGPPPDWTALLSRTGKGQTRNTYANLVTILRHVYGPRLTSNEMTLATLLDGTTLHDIDVSRFREEIERAHAITPSAENTREAVRQVAGERAFHPVRQYLQGIAWDGVLRIDRVAKEILGLGSDGTADASPLALRMLRCWFISCVARAMRPGCKVDTALILVGPQGFHKSTFFSVLAGEWFADSRMDISSKDGLMQLASAWIYEWSELENITSNKAESEVKAFATSTHDTYRPPFARGVVQHPRSSIIVGTTNRSQFLNDPTGSRRFWVLSVERKIDTTELRAWRDQLWAEACLAFEAGERWWLTEEEEADREDAADEHMVSDAIQEAIERWLQTEKAKAMLQNPGYITTGNLLEFALRLEPGRWDRANETRIGRAMGRIMKSGPRSGQTCLTKVRLRKEEGRAWVYRSRD